MNKLDKILLTISLLAIRTGLKILTRVDDKLKYGISWEASRTIAFKEYIMLVALTRYAHQNHSDALLGTDRPKVTQTTSSSSVEEILRLAELERVLGEDRYKKAENVFNHAHYHQEKK